MLTDLNGKTAVVTGAASGIGSAVATRLAAEGMRVVLADIDASALDGAVQRLRDADRDVIGVPTDVSNRESVETLCSAAHEAYGKVHLLHNNAGVLGPLTVPVWETTEDDWRWMMGVNFWSVVHALRVFVPRMLEHGEDGHIVNTASTSGIAFSTMVYSITKHAVVSLSEYLYTGLRQRGSKIGVTCLCPGVTATNLSANSQRRRPVAPQTEAERHQQAAFAERFARSRPAELVAEKVLDAVRTDQFWVTTDNDWDDRFQARFDTITARRNPEALVPPPA
jgi:NAD(P)-dependent dehydrogenase (short-subunit alcohol dehydrogenase family)